MHKKNSVLNIHPIENVQILLPKNFLPLKSIIKNYLPKHQIKVNHELCARQLVDHIRVMT